MYVSNERPFILVLFFEFQNSRKCSTKTMRVTRSIWMLCCENALLVGIASFIPPLSEDLSVQTFVSRYAPPSFLFDPLACSLMCFIQVVHRYLLLIEFVEGFPIPPLAYLPLVDFVGYVGWIDREHRCSAGWLPAWSILSVREPRDVYSHSLAKFNFSFYISREIG